ncbi:hypothetical protein Q9634_004401 [Salmonella enterica]|nr:hypothetical protein [Salmonella enterica]EKS1174203.1 hypothetical protein [Salmonella enterica]ELH0461881.1 hypothetical protein [Salmonella enterica]
MNLKKLSLAIGVSERQIKSALIEQGIDLLMNEAARLQAIEAWDRGLTAADLYRNNIDISFVKTAYENLLR